MVEHLDDLLPSKVDEIKLAADSCDTDPARVPFRCGLAGLGSARALRETALEDIVRVPGVEGQRIRHAHVDT